MTGLRYCFQRLFSHREQGTWNDRKVQCTHFGSSISLYFDFTPNFFCADSSVLVSVEEVLEMNVGEMACERSSGLLINLCVPPLPYPPR